MIKYKLICKSCKISFDSWFASSKEFEKLKKKHLLNCNYCNSNQIEKTLMAPKLITKNLESNEVELKKIKKINNKMKEYQKFIKENFEYVGNNFAYEARSIHYNKNKKEKGIYGNASLEEIKEMNDEGIEINMIPWVNDRTN